VIDIVLAALFDEFLAQSSHFFAKSIVVKVGNPSVGLCQTTTTTTTIVVLCRVEGNGNGLVDMGGKRC